MHINWLPFHADISIIALVFSRIYLQLQIVPILLVVLAAFPISIPSTTLGTKSYLLAVSLLSASSIVLAIFSKSKIQRNFLLMGLIPLLILALDALITHPTIGILILLVVVVACSFLKTESKSPVSRSEVLLAYLILLVIYIIFSPKANTHPGLYSQAVLLASLSVVYLSLFFFSREIKWVICLIGALALVPTLFFGLEQYKALSILAVSLFIVASISVIVMFFRTDTLRQLEARYTNIFSKPEIVVVGYFVVSALLGSALLQLPFSQMGGVHSYIDSLFTSMSAICVTGLIVLDTPIDFSFFGQSIILLLIQFGGLGITSLSAWILLVVSSGRLNISHEETLFNMSGHSVKTDTRTFIKKIFMYFTTVELIGALALTPSFLAYGDNWGEAFWRALFTSISAFCNAGFALQSNSLIPYQDNPYILSVVSVLIVAGGFAPLMVLDFPSKLVRMQFSLQEKIIFSSTIGLLIVGVVFFLFVEWDYSLNSLSFPDRIMNAWFQSVTARTAGFNSVDLTEMRSVSQLFLMILMFIGGNPGSTAGGVKTVTIAVLLIAALNAARERDEARIFYRKISYKTIFRALLVVLLGFGVLFTAYFFLSVTQNIDPISLLFETFSAIGTVGLSTGATSKLDEVGKAIVIFCMLAGRVGPLTFVLLIMKQHSSKLWKVPKEDVSIT